jgi:hypothetical protein
LNFTGRLSLPQPVRYAGLAFAIASAGACGGRQVVTTSPSGSPEASVRAFLNAVKSSDMPAMRDLWGSERGPASSYLSKEEVEQRLTVIRTYLEHESFEFDQPNVAAPGISEQRIVRVRLNRKGCRPVVPFTTVLWKSSWLVKDISLADAGNPARSCNPDSPTPPPPPGT